jgi:hypothetical protein
MNLTTVTSALLAASFALLAAAPTVAQTGLPLAPAGQPALAAIRPTLQNTVPAAVVQVAGNVNLRVHAAVVTPAVPIGTPIFLLIGTPIAAPFAVGAPLLSPAYGLPGFLAMADLLVIQPMTVAGTFGTPPYSLPIPPGLGALGLTLSTQIAVATAAGFGLTGATGIVL